MLVGEWSREPEPESERDAVGLRAGDPQTGEDFAILLEYLGVAQYASVLSGENIHTAAVLRELTDSDLKELGFKMGDRKLVLKWSGS